MGLAARSQRCSRIIARVRLVTVLISGGSMLLRPMGSLLIHGHT